MELKKEGKSYAAIHNYLAPIKLYYGINDVVLNVRKIGKFMPEQRKKGSRISVHIYANDVETEVSISLVNLAF